MMTDEQWTGRLDRQWAELRRQEIILSNCEQDGIDLGLAEHNVRHRARDYGLSVKKAPAGALLQHASNIRRLSH